MSLPKRAITRFLRSGCRSASWPSWSALMSQPPCLASACATELLPLPMPPSRPRTGLEASVTVKSRITKSSPVHDKPAVHIQRLPADVAGARRREEDCHGCHILRLLPPAQRNDAANL